MIIFNKSYYLTKFKKTSNNYRVCERVGMGLTSWQEGWKVQEDDNGDKYGEYMDKDDGNKRKRIFRIS